jgi:transglutaminase-like putative cysteine protease
MPRPRSILVVALLLALAGCRKAKAPSGPPAASEEWFAIQMHGVAIGHRQVKREPVAEDGRALVKVTVTDTVEIDRGADVARSTAELTAVEGPDGELVRFQGGCGGGGDAERVSGVVRRPYLVVDQETGEITRRQRALWPAAARGLFYRDRALAGAAPLKEGDGPSYFAPAWELNVFTAVSHRLDVKKKEKVRLPGEERELFRVEEVVTVPNPDALGQSSRPGVDRKVELHLVHWADERGQVARTRVETTQTEYLRTTKERAQKKEPFLRHDAIHDLAVPVTGPGLRDSTKLPGVMLRVTGTQGRLDGVFRGPHQKVKAIDANTLELTVLAGHALTRAPGKVPMPLFTLPGTGPNPEDSSSGPYIQSGHPLIQQMAQQAVAGSYSPLDRAVRLERHVHNLLRSGTTYARLGGTAVDVARRPEGSCLQHAILLTALARAAGLPARVAFGLAYLPGGQVFAYHAWCKVWVSGGRGGIWLPLDSTVGLGGAPATNLEVLDTSYTHGPPLAFFPRERQLRGKASIAFVLSDKRD